jgi:hypothetical protein
MQVSTLPLSGSFGNISDFLKVNPDIKSWRHHFLLADRKGRPKKNLPRFSLDLQNQKTIEDNSINAFKLR